MSRPPAHTAACAEVELRSGLRVLVEPMVDAHTVATGVWFDVGSRDEPEDRLGVAHFLEHLLFKGSTGRDARALAEAMDRLGGQFNAFTSREHTCFHARTLASEFPAGVHLLADLVLRARLLPEDVERERRVILTELAMIADDPGETADELFARALWGSSPLGRPQAGTVDGVTACDTAAARAFYGEHYVGSRAVVAVAGGIGVDQAVETVAAAFAELPRGATRPGREAAQPGIRNLRAPRRSEQAHLLLGTIGPCLDDARRFPAELLVSVLGGSPSSRLFQAVREDLGLCYDVGAVPAAYTDAGEVAVFLAAAPSAAREAAAVTIGEVRRLVRDGVPEAELALHKDQLLASLWMGLEGTEARMGRLGRLGVAGVRIASPEETADRLAAVTADDVGAFASSLGDPATWATAYVGPKRATPAGWTWADVGGTAAPEPPAHP